MAQDDWVARKVRATMDDIWSKLVGEGWFSVPHRPDGRYENPGIWSAFHDPLASPSTAPDRERDDPDLTLQEASARQFWEKYDRDRLKDSDLGIDR